MLAGAVSVARLGGAVSETLGGWLAGGLTVMVRAADVVVAPSSSVARAVSEYVPAGTLFQAMLYGLVVSLPISVVPWKKSTRATVPSVSLAVALTVMLAGAVNVAPLAGAVSAAVGGVFGGATAVTLTLSTLVVTVPESFALVTARPTWKGTGSVSACVPTTVHATPSTDCEAVTTPLRNDSFSQTGACVGGPAVSVLAPPPAPRRRKSVAPDDVTTIEACAPLAVNESRIMTPAFDCALVFPRSRTRATMSTSSRA